MPNFDEKSDFLDYEFSIRLPAITQLKSGLVQKKELGRGRPWKKTLEPDALVR